MRWATGALGQVRWCLSDQERSAEFTILGRLAAELEYEALHLLERGASGAGPAHRGGDCRGGSGFLEEILTDSRWRAPAIRSDMTDELRHCDPGSGHSRAADESKAHFSRVEGA